jgi:putative transcriptional regulator
VQILPDGSTRPLDGKSDWVRVDAMTEEEAYQNALDDPDNPPLTPERLAKMRRIPNPKKIRTTLNLTQEEFARQFEINLGTLRAWEEGVRMLDGTAITYLRLIEKIPDAIREALQQDAAERAAEAEEAHGARTA